MHKGKFNSTLNPTNSPKQYQRIHFPWARVIVVEHNHVGDIEQYYYDNKECLAIRTGTYSMYDEYALQNGYYGSHVCNPTVIMFPDKDKLVGFKNMHDGITYLRAVRAEYMARLEN